MGKDSAGREGGQGDGERDYIPLVRAKRLRGEDVKKERQAKRRHRAAD